MSNWFQDHPAPSIITYTLVVVGATWATSTFILQDNRLNLAKSEIESQKTLAEQYKSKTEILQKDIELLRSENQEYKSWLAQSKDAIPIMVPQLVELKKQIAKLNTKSVLETELKPQQSQSSVTTIEQTPKNTIPKANPKPIPANFTELRIAQLGKAAIDDTTGTVFTVKSTSADRTANIILSLPDRSQVLEENVYAGKQFKFYWWSAEIMITIIQINFVTDEVTFRMRASAS